MDIEALNKVAIAMVEPGKGLLAADESFGTIGKRFDSINTAKKPISCQSSSQKFLWGDIIP